MQRERKIVRTRKSRCNFEKKKKIILSNRTDHRMKVIAKVYAQQHQKAYGAKDEKIKDRIVSLYKPSVRPFVRGKEVNPVEFGAKVNKLQVDGISFIEHLSFDNFNETTRYAEGVFLQRKLFGKCTHQSADAIYATNKNRTYAGSQNIQTNFVPKGKQKTEHTEQAKQMRTILNRQRSTKGVLATKKIITSCKNQESEPKPRTSVGYSLE